MNDEILSSPANVIWQQYQFAFDDKSSVNDLLFDNIRKKIASLNVHNSDGEIRYKIAQGLPLLVDIYIREQVHTDEVDSLIAPAEALVYKQEPEIEGDVDSSGSGLTGSTSLMAAFNEDDGPQIKTVVNKGAIKDPPATAVPLPEKLQ